MALTALAWACALLGCGQRDELLGTIGAGGPAAPFMMGADISYAQQQESGGERFSDTDGAQRDILAILGDHGFNFVRLRTFVDPGAADGYATMLNLPEPFCDLAHTVAMGARAKAAGLGLLIDFHYSDDWADSSKQVIPLAWQGATSIEQLATLVHDYTKDAVTQLIAGGARPDFVQLGNGITPGILLSPGVVTGSASNWSNLAALLNAGMAGVHEVDGGVGIVLQIDRCGDNAGTRAWVDDALSHQVPLTVLGQSCYTNYQGAPSTWQSNFDDLVARYPDLQFMVSEYSESSADLSGSLNVWRQADDLAFRLPAQRGLGAFVWEPTQWQETLFDDKGNTAALTSPFAPGSPRIALYDQMAADYGLR
jgi:arabinogalactan endo-1,4-beta-galactosidase